MGQKKNEYKRIPLSQLPLGTTLREPIFDANSPEGKDLLLLAAGKVLTQEAVEHLQKRGATEVRVSLRELNRLKKDRSPRLGNQQRSEAVKRAGQEEFRDAIEKFGVSKLSYLHNIQKHGDSIYGPERVARATQQFEDSSEQVALIMDGLCGGLLSDASSMAGASEESLDRIADDIDLMVAMGVSQVEDADSCKHSLQTAVLAMAIGTRLGLKRDQLVELGIGCLVHDVGMRFVPWELVHAERKLSDIEFLEITKHPSITFELLQKMPDVPTGARMVAYQMHERCNGTGYPRRRHGAQIHQLARIAMVADAFVAMVSLRPYREPIMPYQVMETILRGTKQGEFDPDVVRGLLQTTSLFPIGSHVGLSDGRIGRVVRAHPEQFNRPVVEILPTDGSEAESEVVNLATSSDLEIVRALPASGELELEAVASSAT